MPSKKMRLITAYGVRNVSYAMSPYDQKIRRFQVSSDFPNTERFHWRLKSKKINESRVDDPISIGAYHY
jgi:hypothetical protein